MGHQPVTSNQQQNMKQKTQHLLIIILIQLIGLTAFAQAPDWGEADTLACHKIGPGITYSKIYFKGKKMLIWTTEVDLTNPHNKIEQVQSNHKVPDLTRWNVMEHFRNNSYEGHQVCVAFNHDFFSYDDGICIGLNVSDGEIPYGGGWGRSLLTISEDKKANVIQPVLNCHVILPDESQVRIDFFNQHETGFSGNCVLFNRFNGKALTLAGKYILIKPQGKWLINGEDIPCEVLNISDLPIQNTKEEYVIFLRGDKLDSMNSLQVGDMVHISQQLTQGAFGVPLTNILNGFHGYPSIAFEGQLHEGEYNNFENGREYEISSRVMVGTSQDGNTLYIVTNEMSGTSMGINCIDITNYMLAHGAWNVVNFDSGGSSAIVVDEEMLNYPARGSVRPVMDALLAVSLAPEHEITAGYTFLTPSIYPPAASSTQLHLLGLSAYEEVTEKEVTGFTFTCIPEELGYVDDNQVFHSGIRAYDGKIIAEKNGIQTELRVYTSPVEDIYFNPVDVLTDKREYPIVVETKIGATVFQINPNALSWEVADPTICKITNGIMEGLAEGETTITGTFGDITKTLHVKVEIGKGKQAAEDFDDMSTFSVKSTGAKNITLVSHDTHNAALEFDFSGGRGPYIELAQDLTFYGLPDSLTWDYIDEDQILKEFVFTFETAKKETYTFKFNPVENQTKQHILIPFATEGDAWGVPMYPLQFKKVKIFLNTGASKKYSLPFNQLFAHYREADPSGIHPNHNQRFINIFAKNNRLYLYLDSDKAEKLHAQIFSLDGKLMQTLEDKLDARNNQVRAYQLNTLSKGVYIVKLQIGKDLISEKIIIY